MIEGARFPLDETEIDVEQTITSCGFLSRIRVHLFVMGDGPSRGRS